MEALLDHKKIELLHILRKGASRKEILAKIEESRDCLGFVLIGCHNLQLSCTGNHTEYGK